MNIHFLKTAEGRIAYDEMGDGPVVICVPGMGDLRGEYRFLAPQLAAAGYRAVMMDVRGHGEASVTWADYSVAGIGADIVALARALDAGPVLLVGNSMAAGAAVWAAAEAPELFNGLALIGPAVHGEAGWLFRRVMDVLFARPWGPAAWLRYYTTLFPSRQPDDFTVYSAGLKDNLTQPGRLEALHKMMAASKAASESRLARVHAPVLVLMGSRDPDFKDPEAEARWVAEQVRGSYQMIAGAGHYPFSEMPEVTGPKLIEFFNALQPEARHAEIAR